MITQDILNEEALVTDRIILHYEGMFWKAYERSAFLFVTQVKDFKPVRQRFKKLGGKEIIFIGLPDTSLESTIGKHPLVAQTPTTRTYGGFQPLSEQEFQNWKNRPASIPAAIISPTSEPEPVPNKIEQRLREFDLLNRTPFDCMQLVSELKRMLQ